MRSGTHENIRDVTRDLRYREARHGIAAEICIPIKVQGTTIGTLNLESPIQDNYAASQPSILAFAGAVGRAFEEASSARTKLLIDQAALSIAKRHDIDNHVTALRRSLETEKLSENASKALETFTKRARRTLSEMRGKAVIDAKGPSTLRQAIHASVQALDTTLTVPDIPENPLFDAYLDPFRATAITLALTNLFQNAIGHVDPSPRGLIGSPRRVMLDSTYLDGTECIVISVQNQIRFPIPPARLAGLYHYPLTGKSEELRLGAFLAGLAAQRVGGRLHAYQSPDGRTLTSVFVIPGEVVEGVS
jgi:hypothetical protein